MDVLRKGFRSVLSHRRLLVGLVVLVGLLPAPARAEQDALPHGVIVASSVGYLGCFYVDGQPGQWCLVAFDSANGVELHVWSATQSESATDPAGSISAGEDPNGSSVVRIDANLPELGKVEVQSTAGRGVLSGYGGCCWGGATFELDSHPTAADPLVRTIHEPHRLSGSLGASAIADGHDHNDLHWTGATSGSFVVVGL